MRQGWGWVVFILIGLAVVFIGGGVGLYLLGGSDQSALERLMNISVIFIALSMILVVVLLGVLVGLAVWIALLLKNRTMPALEALLLQVTGMVGRVRGTTEFVSEEVASPIISFYSRVAGVRALVKTVTRGKRR